MLKTGRNQKALRFVAAVVYAIDLCTNVQSLIKADHLPVCGQEPWLCAHGLLSVFEILMRNYWIYDPASGNHTDVDTWFILGYYCSDIIDLNCEVSYTHDN